LKVEKRKKKVGYEKGGFSFVFSPQLIKVVVAPGSYAQSEIVHIKYHWRNKTARARQLLQEKSLKAKNENQQEKNKIKSD
jgi:hypothetical protein